MWHSQTQQDDDDDDDDEEEEEEEDVDDDDDDDDDEEEEDVDDDDDDDDDEEEEEEEEDVDDDDDDFITQTGRYGANKIWNLQPQWYSLNKCFNLHILEPWGSTNSRFLSIQPLGSHSPTELTQIWGHLHIGMTQIPWPLGPYNWTALCQQNTGSYCGWTKSPVDRW